MSLYENDPPKRLQLMNDHQRVVSTGQTREEMKLPGGDAQVRTRANGVEVSTTSLGFGEQLFERQVRVERPASERQVRNAACVAVPGAVRHQVLVVGELGDAGVVAESFRVQLPVDQVAGALLLVLDDRLRTTLARPAVELLAVGRTRRVVVATAHRVLDGTLTVVALLALRVQLHGKLLFLGSLVGGSQTR